MPESRFLIKLQACNVIKREPLSEKVFCRTPPVAASVGHSISCSNSIQGEIKMRYLEPDCSILVFSLLHYNIYTFFTLFFLQRKVVFVVLIEFSFMRFLESITFSHAKNIACLLWLKTIFLAKNIVNKLE